MPQENTIEAVRNRKTQKLFIVVDDTLDTRYKVINPSGEILILPDLLFEDDAIGVSSDRFDAEFTKEQLAALNTYNEKAAELARLEALRA